MTKEEILIKAIKDYPIGTTFISASCAGNPRTVQITPVFHKDMIATSLDKCNGIIYCERKWAKIISLPHPKIYELW